MAQAMERAANSTSLRLFAKYHSNTGRPAVDDQRTRALLFRSYARTLGPWLPPERSARILDVGCGEGWLLSFLRDRGYSNLEGFDLSPENVEICQRLGLGGVRQFDALRLGELEQRDGYDAIFALDLLEHLPKEQAAPFIAGAREHLKRGGTLIIQTPNAGSILGFHNRYGCLSHEFALTENTARVMLRLGGFSDPQIEVAPSWNATTPLGYLREYWLTLMHRAVFLGDDSSRPKIPTKNLLIKGIRA